MEDYQEVIHDRLTHGMNLRIPKILFYGELAHGTRTQGGQYKRFKDNIKHHLQEGGTELARWEQTATDRSGWRRHVNQTVVKITQKRVQRTHERKARRIAAASVAPTLSFVCSTCNKPCRSAFGLQSHSRVHTGKKPKLPLVRSVHNRYRLPL